jgi:hypothetical protein
MIFSFPALLSASTVDQFQSPYQAQTSFQSPVASHKKKWIKKPDGH